MSYYRNQKIANNIYRIENEKRTLLSHKKNLLTKLAGVVNQQEALMNRGEWDYANTGRSSHAGTGRQVKKLSLTSFRPSRGSGMATGRSDCSVASMASFRGKNPEHTFTAKIERPANVPPLF